MKTPRPLTTCLVLLLIPLPWTTHSCLENRKEDSCFVNSKETALNLWDENTAKIKENFISNEEIETPVDDFILKDTNSKKDYCSSVWCHSSQESKLVCTFNNLYYTNIWKKFVFVVCSHSIVYGINDVRELHSHLFTTSVEGHSAFVFRLSVLPWKQYIHKYRRRVLAGMSVLMARFKPDNLLHVFHDDLLPLYFTLKETCLGDESCMQNINVIFIDENNHGKYWHLYNKIAHKVQLLNDLNDSMNSGTELWCFEKVRVGANKMSVWYQYGFGKPQGPISTALSGPLISDFAKYFKKRLNISASKENTLKGILITRKTNRKILNEDEVVNAMKSKLSEFKRYYPIEVKTISEETSGVVDMIVEVSGARVVAGMHGAALVLALFLPPGAVLIEMFPYGVDAKAATVYRSLSKLKNSKIIYKAWENKDFLNTVYHPEYPVHYGGIDGLNSDTKELIVSLQNHQVKTIECCENPDWLFRIYQDTYVNVNEHTTGIKSILFQSIVFDSLLQSEKYLQERRDEKIFLTLPVTPFPSVVEEVQCTLEWEGDKTTLFVKWSEPWNVADINCSNMWYELAIQADNGNPVITDLTQKSIHKTWKEKVITVQLWLTSYCGSLEGQFVFYKCSLK